jgi:BirA family biotin operon repressor/biotin-[acetyl-CoA-carboxylase] ligase
MLEAAKLLPFAPHGTMVIAHEQTDGQGRHGRTWHSEASSGLYLSLILRPHFAIETSPALTLAIGLATRAAIRDQSGIECDLRWPNDLMIGARKCGGILVQLFFNAVVAGIGVNVNHVGFPPDLSGSAISLRLSSGREHLREPLAAAIADQVDAYCDRIAESGAGSVIAEFCRVSSYASGMRVSVELADGLIEGVTAGLDPRGFLLIREDSGRTRTVAAGGVRPVDR